MSFRPLAPRLRQIPPRKSALLSILDIGASKIVCLIARLAPLPASDGNGRTHKAIVLGIGHQRSRGVKAGAIVNLDAAESAIRHAIDAAERMAGVEVDNIIVNVSGGRLSTQIFNAKIAIHGKAVRESDVHRVLETAALASAKTGRSVLHALPVGYWLDGTSGVRDPLGMVGHELGAQLHVASCDAAAAHNLMLAVERCHLRVAAVVASPYAAGLASLTDDEAELGAALVDFGAGSTTVGVFAGGRLAYVDAVAVGGNHITMDIARGLSVTLADAERLKTLYGACLASPTDDRDTISIARVGDESSPATHLPKSELVRIIRPRTEEILELVRDRLRGAGQSAHVGRRLVLTGGACQLSGLAELARLIVSDQTRIGRPQGVEGLPESAQSPAYATTVGLLAYPQVAGLEHFEPRRAPYARSANEDGYVARVGRWLKESF